MTYLIFANFPLSGCTEYVLSSRYWHLNTRGKKAHKALVRFVNSNRKAWVNEKPNVFFRRKDVWNSLWPAEMLQENTCWTVVPFFELMVQNSCCFVHKTHLKVKSKKLLYAKNRLKKKKECQYLSICSCFSYWTTLQTCV